MIKKWGRKVIDYFFNPCPTLFDLCACFGVLGISFIRPALRGFYLEFYTIFLVIIGFNYEQKRHFNGASLTLLGLISLSTLFLHSYKVAFRSISFQYLNFYLMHEGFAYIFFGCLLFYIVATKSTNLRLLMFTLPVVMKVWIGKMLYSGQMTPMMAVGVGFFAFLLYRRQFKWAIFVALVAIDVAVFKREWLMMKFECRPYIWAHLIELIKHPPYIGSYFIERYQDSKLTFFVGSGYNKLLIPDNFINVKVWGNAWLFRQNDYLSIMAYIGIFAIIPIIMFIKELFARFKYTWFIALLIAFCTLSFFQMTFAYPDRVIVILLSLSWCYVEL